VLVVTPFSVHPLIHGGAVRIFNLVRRMAGWCDVSLLILSGGTDDPEQRRAYQTWCERVLFHRISENDDAMDDPWGLLPPSPARFTFVSVADRIEALVDAHAFDVVQLEYAELGAYVSHCGAAKTVLTEIDVGFQTQARQRSLAIGERFGAADRVGRGDTDGLRQERFEILACEAADQVHCMSGEDRELLAARVTDSSHLRVIPNGVDTSVFRPPAGPSREGALFLGSFPHLPNLDAFELLVDEIWPAVRRRLPDARLTVAGARPPDGVLAWDGRDGIQVVGEVDDVVPLYQTHRVLVVPLRAGSGTRLKILEALSCGLPVVSTTIGVEGIDLSRPPEVLIADTPDEIVDAVVELLEVETSDVEATGRRGRELAVERYDWDVIADDLRRAHGELALRDLPAPTEKEPEPESQPDITVVIPTSNDQPVSDSLIEGLRRQRTDASIEVVCVDHGSPDEALDALLGLGLRVASLPGHTFNQGAALNTGARAARGRVIVFTAARCVPDDEDWLARLVAPFAHHDAPAAVQGGITTQLTDGAPPHYPTFTRESERWRSAHHGLEFSAVNAAMRRDIWERFPFPPYASLADRAWQRLAAANNLLILPCWAAAVRHVTGGGVGFLFQNSLAEGRAWRRLGGGYSTADLAADIFWPRPSMGNEGQPSFARTADHLLYGWTRSIGLFLGR
jgi:glycosyltransferase involved in cell wall biosynthesis